MIKVRANGKVYMFDESSEILDLLDMKAFDVQDDPEYSSAEGIQKEISVAVPFGTVRAVESADTDNPGIFLSYIEKCGTERSTLLLEYNEASERMKGYIWSPKDPDGDPVQEFFMDQDPEADMEEKS